MEASQESPVRKLDLTDHLSPDSAWWDVDTMRHLDDNFPFLRHRLLDDDSKWMSSAYEDDFAPFRLNGEILLWDFETDNVFYLGETIEEAELMFEVVRLNGWEYSIFPRLDDDHGAVLSNQYRIGGFRECNRFKYKKIHNAAERLEGPALALAEIIEQELDFYHPSPFRIMHLVALYTYLDRENPSPAALFAHPTHRKLALDILRATATSEEGKHVKIAKAWLTKDYLGFTRGMRVGLHVSLK